MKKQDYDYLYKIVLVGDSSVGKTSFMIRYTKNIVSKVLEPTIGVEYATKNIILKNGEGIVKVQMWDTAGSEKYRSITTAQQFQESPNMARRYNNQQYLLKIQDNTDEGIIIAVVGNKLDLVEVDAQKRAIPLEDIYRFCEKHKLLYNECSAKTGYNVKESLEDLIEKIYDQNEGKQVMTESHGGTLQQSLKSSDHQPKVPSKQEESKCCL